MLNTGRVSVIVPCFNQGHFLSHCLDSVLQQRHSSIEVIVINDGSTDDTAVVAARYNSRIKYVEQPNRGLSAARNTGVRNATGEFLHFLDADDYILPGFYERAVDVFRARPDVSAVYSGCQIVDIDGAVQRIAPRLPESANVFHELLTGNPWPCHALLLRKEAVDIAGSFETRLTSCEDWDMWLRVAAQGGKFVPIAEDLACYRWYATSMSKRQRTMFANALTVIRRNSDRHVNCRACQVSTDKGIQHSWDLYVRPEVEANLAGRRFCRLLWCSLQLGLRLPRSGWWCLKPLWQRTRRSIRLILGRRD